MSWISDVATETVILYVLFAVIAFVVSFFPPWNGVFNLVQILLFWKDIGDTDDTHRFGQNLVAALINIAIGGLLKDTFTYGCGIVVVLLLFVKVLS